MITKIKNGIFVNIQMDIKLKQTQKQKITPQKHSNGSNKNSKMEQSFGKELPSPFFEGIFPSKLGSSPRLRNQPEYLLSPSPVKKDLFSQLLGTQLLNQSPLKYQSEFIMEEDSFSSSISEMSEDDSMEGEESSCLSELNIQDENQLKKRKRKSTVQIKLLKQELNGDLNWTKEKIMKMAKITGLSQSQVYKWCWDQKKKQVKKKQESYLERRKLIRKEHKIKYNKYDESEESSVENHFTKPKLSQRMEENAETEKKVKKRLIFS